MAVIDPALLESGVAIVGMSARLPGARNVDEFWENLRSGTESLLPVTEEELLERGVSPHVLTDPNYIKVSGSLSDVEMFDAGYFGLSPKDAAITDPQHRHFLECAVEAFENAGHSTHRFGGAIGVFAGCGMNSYLINNLLTNPEMVRSVGSFLLRHTGNDRDFLPTTVSYKLDLTGPSMAIQTACSTSLVAIHVACQSLLSGECEMAVAGGSTILVPNGEGYFHRENEPVSPDGHCRAFDADSAGTVLTSGTGVIVLRRLEDALEDGDTIHAVIRGSAVNNDGAGKIGYMAPSVEGHASVVAEALAVADVSADSISYVEAHGTGTRVGDPIEISALTEAFRNSTDRNQFCRIGSVKTNIGHLDTAAGVASLIKVVKSLEAQEIAPTLHFKKPNPGIDFESSPFVVNAELRPWETDGVPRRAGVSSLGIGGTNAHVVLEEAPESEPSSSCNRKQEALVLSAKSRSALDSASQNLMSWLRDNPEANLADVAFTLQEGRDYWDHRLIVTANSTTDAVTALQNNSSVKVFSGKADAADGVAFMFSGAGGQYPNMARDLYLSETVFRDAMDECLNILGDYLDFDLKALMLLDPENEAAAAVELEKPSRLCPAVVATEWSLAQLWMSWGINPSSMIGHSLGEYVAACVAEVLTLRDMLKVVVLRGNLIEQLSGGAMISLPLSEEEAREIIGDSLDLAAVNSPGLCVASGTVADVQALADRLADIEIEARMIPVNAAGHSRHLDPILEEFRSGLKSIQFSEPKIKYVSNVTGSWARSEDVTSPNYWVQHLRNTVRFSDGVKTLIQSAPLVLLEVGPGQALCTFARQQADKPLGVVPSLRRNTDEIDDQEYLRGAFARLWIAGLDVPWVNLRDADEFRRRIPLPTYPFEHKPYWVEPGNLGELAVDTPKYLNKHEDIDSWFLNTDWREEPLDSKPETDAGQKWLVFLDDAGVGAQATERLRAAGNVVVTASIADNFFKTGDHEYKLAPEQGRDGFEHLVAELTETDLLPERILHLWGLTPDETYRPGSSFLDRNQECGFYSILYLMQSLGEAVDALKDINIVVNGMASVGDEQILYPEKSTVLGPVRVIPREYPWVSCRCVNVELPTVKSSGFYSWLGVEEVHVDKGVAAQIADCVIQEILAQSDASVVAWRGSHRFVETFRPKRMASLAEEEPGFRENGVYLVTGGLGGLGFALAEQIATKYKARMVLIGRTPFPEESTWDDWLVKHGELDSTAKKIRAIRQIRANGGDVWTTAADVTNFESMQKVVEGAGDRFGGINGVLHAAAAVSDGILQSKSKEEIERIFAPKLYGTLVLDKVLEGQPLDFLVLFSSTSAIVGLPGQIDYAGANAFLNAFANARNRAGKRTLAIDWGIWSGIGGATRIAGQMRNQSVEPDYVRPTTHPLMGDCTLATDAKWQWEAKWSANDLWILDEHRNQDNVALLPGTGYLEIAHAAFNDVLGDSQFEIKNTAFLQPLVVNEEEHLPVKIELSRERNRQGYRLRVSSARVGEAEVEHATMELASITSESYRINPAEVASKCTNNQQTAQGAESIPSSQEAQLGFGPRWSVIRSIGYGENQVFADLRIEESYDQDFAEVALHPAMLDIATSIGIPLIKDWSAGEFIYVPVAYGSVRVYGPLEPRFFAQVTNHSDNSRDKEIAQFDVILASERGQVLAEIENYQMRRLDPNSGFASHGSKTTSSRAHSELTEIESVFLESYDNGIELEEGTRALEEILSHVSNGVTVVSSINLDDWRERIGTACASPGEGGGVTFTRPDLDSEYEAPRDSIENELVKIWQGFLGVDQIGIHDDFFDLGGHSLIAVRIFARIKKKWGVDWPISMLFDAPNVAAFADLLREQVDEEDTTGTDTEKKNERFRYLVNMNRVTDSQRPPLFVVAGMFGNVLNLRHLATHLGEDQPVYALQAKGLYGDDEPHTSFKTAASDYIAEIRKVQPNGPYMIGGFSGGGVTAFEIAHQILAEGDDVSALVMLDAIPPHPAWPLATWVDRVDIRLQRFWRETLRNPVAWLKQRILWEFEKRGMLKQSVERTPAEFRSDQIEAAFMKCLAGYEMKVLPTRIYLYRPPLDTPYKLRGGRRANSYGALMENENWWGPWTEAGVEVQVVPGDHDSMVLEPNVTVLAKHVRRQLDDAVQEETVLRPTGGETELDISNEEQGVRRAS